MFIYFFLKDIATTPISNTSAYKNLQKLNKTQSSLLPSSCVFFSLNTLCSFCCHIFKLVVKAQKPNQPHLHIFSKHTHTHFHLFFSWSSHGRDRGLNQCQPEIHHQKKELQEWRQLSWASSLSPSSPPPPPSSSLSAPPSSSAATILKSAWFLQQPEQVSEILPSSSASTFSYTSSTTSFDSTLPSEPHYQIKNPFAQTSMHAQ